MADPVSGPCQDWATIDDVTDLCCVGVDRDRVVDKLPAASGLLYRMSGGQFPGVCEVTLIPDPVCGGTGPVVTPTTEGWWVPEGIDNTLAVNRLCGCSTDGRRLRLPFTPAVEVDEVTINGDTLDASAYQIENFTHLVRIDGGRWPSSNPDGDWTVAYSFGVSPPPEAVAAVLALACELAKACDPESGDCALPARAVRASRAGVEYELEPADLLTEGRTGIFEIDLFLQAVNPRQLRKPAGVRSPDIPRGRVAT